MLDMNLLRENPEIVRKALLDRQDNPAPVDSILALDEKRRGLLAQVEQLKAERNVVSKEIGKMKDATERQSKIEAMRVVGDQITELDKLVAEVESELNYLMSTLPNIPDPRTPYGKDDSENIVIKTVGEPRKFDFTPLPHWDLGPALGIIDFERGTKLTGSR
ncbi:MAG TPA: serine--tRNA ligase, partial [Anaerolineales bacterium]|nr:serine--tRNA ligase [Anaerolineales bacterium]